MVSVLDGFKKYGFTLPWVEGHFYTTQFFNKNPDDDTFRYGAFYGQEGGDTFVLVIEAFEELQDISTFRKIVIKGEELFTGYTPNFKLANSVKSSGDSLSWIDGFKIFTLIGIQQKAKDYISLVQDSKPIAASEALSRLYENIQFFSSEFGGFSLKTLLTWISIIADDDGEDHIMRHAQGNYFKADVKVNVEIRSTCKHNDALGKLKIDNLQSAIIINGNKLETGIVNNRRYFQLAKPVKQRNMIVHAQESISENILLKIFEELLEKNK